jgi:exopolyphosphatase/guanosine-5'-triphosphate,3'-diphosphate pyrophosphatase
MLAVFKEFGLEQMVFSEGALRLGVLYDLVGRYQHQDQREATVRQFMRRYHVEAGQARRLRGTAFKFLGQILSEALDPEEGDGLFLRWAANLHEVGISVAHSGYHKHSAYILANADMPGFSRMDQARLARLVLAHRGKLERVQGLDAKSRDWLLILALRLAVLLHRARDGSRLPSLRLKRTEAGFAIRVDTDWLDNSPLTAAALQEELKQWAALGLTLTIESPAGGARRA